MPLIHNGLPLIAQNGNPAEGLDCCCNPTCPLPYCEILSVTETETGLDVEWYVKWQDPENIDPPGPPDFPITSVTLNGSTLTTNDDEDTGTTSLPWPVEEIILVVTNACGETTCTEPVACCYSIETYVVNITLAEVSESCSDTATTGTTREYEGEITTTGLTSLNGTYLLDTTPSNVALKCPLESVSGTEIGPFELYLRQYVKTTNPFTILPLDEQERTATFNGTLYIEDGYIKLKSVTYSKTWTFNGSNIFGYPTSGSLSDMILADLQKRTGTTYDIDIQNVATCGDGSTTSDILLGFRWNSEVAITGISTLDCGYIWDRDTLTDAITTEYV